MTADADKGAASRSKGSKQSDPRPVSKALLAAAWLVPGLGHWLLGKRVRAAVFAALVVASFTTGVLLHGELAVPEQRSPLSWFFSFGALGNGVLYLGRLLWINGLDGLFGSGFPYGLHGGGDPTAAGFFYGKTFLYTGGLMNLLVMLDVHDIARGDKD